MSDPLDLDTLVGRIHAAPVKLVLAITGGGSRAIAELLERPGGSRVLLEAIVPYAADALTDFLQAKPEQFCAARTARLMAMAWWSQHPDRSSTPASSRQDPVHTGSATAWCRAHVRRTVAPAR